MDKVNEKFGKVTVRKVSTITNSALGNSCDLYFARIKNRRLSEQAVLVVTPHDPQAPNINVLSQLSWSSFHVRSYANAQIMYEALEGKVSSENISATEKTLLEKVDWGKSKEVELKVVNSLKDKNIYESSSLPQMKLVLFSSYKNNEQGNELESQIDLIPAMNTLNFAIIKE